MKRITSVEAFPFEKKASYSPAEIGVLIGVSAQTVRARIRAGTLFASVRGRRYRVPLASFMQYLGVPPQIRVTRGRKALRIDDEFGRAES